MISVCHDNEGRVIAYAEWRQVAQSGFDKLHGDYIFIADFWIHDSYKNPWYLYRELMQDIWFKAEGASKLYFNRRKYNDRMSKLYSKEQIMKLILREMVEA